MLIHVSVCGDCCVQYIISDNVVGNVMDSVFVGKISLYIFVNKTIPTIVDRAK